ncbi:MAG: transporter [Candidatus Omnitrophica bacterium]|nr:transporter [Candidatus Omnitrophota bacterium]
MSCPLKKRLLAAAALLSAILPDPAQAFVANRPLSTEDGYTLEEGTFALAAGAVYTKQDTGDRQASLNLDIGVGLPMGFELSVETPYTFLDPVVEQDVDGPGDIILYPEWGFLPEGPLHPALSLAASVKSASGNEDKGLGTGERDYSLYLSGSKRLGKATLHGNLGYTWTGEPKGADKDNSISYSLAGEYALNRRWVLEAELIGQTNSDPAASDDLLEGLAGFICNLSPHLALDAGIGIGFTDASPDLRATAGLTWSF